MSHILITGGTGNLGQAFIARWQQTDHKLRAMSRKPIPSESGVQWVQADIETGSGVADAVRGVDVVVNCASSPAKNTYDVDVLGTQKLAAEAKAQQVKHFLHISIVHIDQVPIPYYQHKLGAEQAVIDSGIPYSILRIVQFHSLLDFYLRRATQAEKATLTIPTDAQFQTIDTSDVAEYVLPYLTEPGGRLADLGGPQILNLGDMARQWLEARGIQREIVHAKDTPGDWPTSMEAINGYRQGCSLVPENRYGTLTWADYLKQ